MQDGRDHGSGTLRFPSSHHRNTYISEQIRDEIGRFESVHPWIYNSYELISNIPNSDLQENLRTQILQIEDAFVNSQEWTMSRIVQDIRLVSYHLFNQIIGFDFQGVVGSLDSGKTALVHYYLTENYANEPSFEGGRFKKEVLINGRSNLLLIREEGATPPSVQVCIF